MRYRDHEDTKLQNKITDARSSSKMFTRGGFVFDFNFRRSLEDPERSPVADVTSRLINPFTKCRQSTMGQKPSSKK
jgi:hypothetical protein